MSVKKEIGITSKEMSEAFGIPLDEVKKVEQIFLGPMADFIERKILKEHKLTDDQIVKASIVMAKAKKLSPEGTVLLAHKATKVFDMYCQKAQAQDLSSLLLALAGKG
jgi:uncharacterized FlgJ-related protein